MRRAATCLSLILLTVTVACDAGAAPAQLPAHSPAQGSAQGPKIRLQTVIKGLSSPVDFVSDGSADRTFVVEQPGRMRLIVKGRLESTPYLNIADRVMHQGELGFLGVAFHPEFATNGYFY